VHGAAYIKSRLPRPDDSAWRKPRGRAQFAVKEQPVTESRDSSASETTLPVRQPAGGWTARQVLIAAAALLVLAAAALAIDMAAARSAEALKLPGDIGRLVTLAEVFGWGGTVALILLTAATLDERGWRIVPRLALGAYGAGLLADSCKLLVARQRPSGANLNGGVLGTFVEWLPLLNHDSTLGPYYFRLQSFPSGHAATAAGLAIALAALYPRGRWLFAAFAALACLQRVHAHAHFPSDVLAGAAIGCLVGAMCTASGRVKRWLVHLEHPAMSDQQSKM
jgi:membrane-associated phospholipid phosphatase